jgi:ribosomal protein S27E
MKLPFDLKDIKPGTFSYLTKRKLTNKEGKETGEIFLWKERGEKESRYVMKCPFCKEEQDGVVVLERRPYRVRCSKCDRSITLPKLRDEAKK